MLKQYKEEKQDAYEGLSEMYKPIIDSNKNTDEKQDQLIKQLQENQKAITSGLEDVFIFNRLPETTTQETKLPLDYKPSMMVKSPQYKSDLDKGFDPEEIQSLIKYNLFAPSDVLKGVRDGSINFDKYNQNLSKLTMRLGGDKGRLSKNKKSKQQNANEIDLLTKEIKLLQKYNKRISVIPEGIQTIGKGIYTQKRRNAYKIDPKNGVYGGLMIDLPKLFGQLRIVAHKNGEKVYDKQADFDTIDIFTKRFNSRKNYSPLSKMIFNDLNTLSEIPIHKTSNKYKKLGAGVVYYNNPEDLLSRLELLGGSILAGNNGVKNEFSAVAHALNKLGVLDNDRLNDLLREYVI
ncbi:uncharacterized protein [Montipora foliosa]|uniref:uncharacterized protein n=1 Tax=Montipora foliosa TaxID=591990 RepID=UPI0035F1EECF